MELILVILGLCLGSFVNALVWRVRQQELEAKSQKPNAKKKIANNQLPATSYSVLRGRSMCPDCKHTLSAADLVPVLSWLILKGKCRYCKNAISAQYPLVELAMATVFVVSCIYWPETLSGGQWLLFGGWLASCVGLMALAVYDLKWMLLPNRILYPTLAVASTGRFAYIILFSDTIISDTFFVILSIAVASGVFWILFHLSKGRWIGYGDVRLGLVLGVLLASPVLAFLMIFTASLLGTIYSLPLMMVGKQRMASKIPFGPFLILATLLVVLFGESFISWYKVLIL